MLLEMRLAMLKPRVPSSLNSAPDGLPDQHKADRKGGAGGKFPTSHVRIAPTQHVSHSQVGL
jgi:hypothetical protein